MSYIYLFYFILSEFGKKNIIYIKRLNLKNKKFILFYYDTSAKRQKELNREREVYSEKFYILENKLKEACFGNFYNF